MFVGVAFRRGGAFIALLAMVAIMLVVPSGKAQAASAQQWAKDIEGMIPYLHAAPDKSVAAVNCSQAAHQSYAIRTWSSSGAVTGTTPVPPALKKWGNPCNGGVEQVGPDGMMYIPYYDYTNGYTNYYSSLKAVKNGVVKWTYLPAQKCAGVSSEIADIVVSGGFVYLLLISPCNGTWQPYTHELVKLDASTKAQVFRKGIGSYKTLTNNFSLAAYTGGLVVRLGARSTFTFKYFDFNGVEATAKRYTLQLSGYEYYAALLDGAEAQIRVTHDGTLIMPVIGNSDTVSCNENRDKVKKLIKRTITGVVYTYNLESQCFSAESVRVLSDGTTLFMRTSGSDGDYQYPDRIILKVNAAGAISYLSSPIPDDTTHAGYRYRHFEVDRNGNIVIARSVRNSSGERDTFVIVDVLGPDGSLRSRTTSAFAPDDGRTDTLEVLGSGKMSMANGALYMVALNSGTATQLLKFVLPYVGMDYPRNVLLGATPPSAIQKNYVALGDSYSSGEGVSPFDPMTTLSGMNECHRSNRAYAKLLDQDPGLNLRLQAFKACSGATTANVTGAGKYSGESTPQVNSITAATNVVTITIGGNDVGFEAFAAKCIGVPWQESSLCDASTQEYWNAMNAIDNTLPGRLTTTFNAVKSKATNTNAKVYVVGYPQLVPLSNEPRQFPYCGWIDNDNELIAARSVVTALNNKLRAATTAAGPKFVYVDAERSPSPFIGYELCDSDSYFYGINPDDLDTYSVHPNAAGQEAYARLIKASLS